MTGGFMNMKVLGDAFLFASLLLSVLQGAAMAQAGAEPEPGGGVAELASVLEGAVAASGPAEWSQKLEEKDRTIADLLARTASAEAEVAAMDDLSAELTSRREAALASEQKLKERLAALEGELGDADSRVRDARKEVKKQFSGQVKELEGERGRMVRELEALRNRKVDVRDSDLYKQLEKANLTLRSKVVELEELRKRNEDEIGKLGGRLEGAERSAEASERRMRGLQADLSDVGAREKEYKQLIEKMMVRVPDLEAAVAELEQQVAERERDISERESRIGALETALEERDHRLRRAERVAEVLEEHKREVLHVNDVEKRDMHYNMAMVYAQEGRAAEAEVEYLSALELDPTHTDIHFNLAILYEEQLKRREKAAIHYRRYLKLAPHGDDSDSVRNWLLRLEMNK
jgi:chromosome segregation ATPase